MSDYGDDFDDSALDEIAQIESTFTSRNPVPGPSQNPARFKQMTLLGGTVPLPPPKTVSQSQGRQHASSSQNDPFPKTVARKRWDRIVAAKKGWAADKKGKGKARARDSEDEHDQDEADDLDDFIVYDDASMDPHAPPPPIKLLPDPEAVKTWIYPLNKPLRSYQFNITQKALYNNVLVSLPTGLGKTFIAAVVMRNFARWYPKGRVIFMAPTRPLVEQQIEACHSIAGIPAREAVWMTGNDPPASRRAGYKEKRVIYATPQTIANDLTSSALDPSDVICVVVDEAHKASGEYGQWSFRVCYSSPRLTMDGLAAYCGVIRFLMTKNPHFRVLALTATPGSKAEAVQAVVDNLHVRH
jgi:superfamily II DNA or RNA helicase